MKGKIHFVILAVAFVAALLTSGFTEQKLSRIIVSTYYNLMGTQQVSTKYDESGIPIVDYGYRGHSYIGEQRNAVTISQVALRYYEEYEKGDESCQRLFINCANWLVENSVSHDDYAILEYRFDWPRYNMTSPWRSGMAQGQALQVLIRAHNISNDSKYLDTAKRLLNSFFVGVENGGVTYVTLEDGWWYEEYADEGGMEPRVLNGMMYALLGINEYYDYTKDPDAKYLFDQGVIALKEGLADYDANGYSYYDVFGTPSLSYHETHIRQLNDLYEITNEETFKDYRDRWQSYEELPFVVRLVHSPTKMGIAVFFANFIILILVLEVTIFAILKLRKRTWTSR
jgi:heparosan-N-sulfate-glucuronate 5-epimerase